MYFEMDCPCKGKYLDKMMQPAILSILYDNRLHGFSLIQKLSENPMFDGAMPDKAGVYRYLKKMEDSGLLISDWTFEDDGTKPKKIFAITDKGKNCLSNWGIALQRYQHSLGKLVAEIEQKTN